MKRVAIIQDSIEVMRQPWADVGEFFARVVDRSGLSRGDVTIGAVADNDVYSLLASINREPWSLLIFTSNCLLRREGPIWQAVEDRAADIKQFIAEGGAVLILQQAYDDDGRTLPFLPDGAELAVRIRPEPFAPIQADEIHIEADSMLAAPHLIESIAYQESESVMWRGALPLYYRCTDVASSPGFEAVMSVPDGALIARLRPPSGPGLISCNIPIDWARDEELTRNLIEACLFGDPQLVVFSYPDPARNSVIQARLKNSTSAGAFELPESWNALTAAQDRRLASLLVSAHVCFFPDVEALGSVELPRQLQKFLAGGGVIAAGVQQARAAVLPTAIRQIHVYVGARSAIELVDLVLDRISLIGSESPSEPEAQGGDWPSEWQSHDLYTLIGTLRSLQSNEVVRISGKSIPRAEQYPGVLRIVNERLAASWLDYDPATANALLRTLYLGWPSYTAAAGTLHRWLGDGIVADGEQLRQLRATRALFTDDQADVEQWLCLLRDQIGADAGSTVSPSVASLARALDDLWILEQADLVTPQAVASRVLTPLADILSHVLGRNALYDSYGWLSIDITAQILRGMASLHRLAPDDRVLGLMAGSVTVLERWLVKYIPTNRNIASLLKVASAVLACEVALPSSGEQFVRGGVAARSWITPASSAAESWPLQSNAALRATIDRLSTRIETLDARFSELAEERSRSIGELTVLHQEELDRQRIPAGIGRFMYWIGILLLILAILSSLAVAIYALALGHGEVGFGAISAEAVWGALLGLLWKLGRQYGFRKEPTA